MNAKVILLILFCSQAFANYLDRDEVHEFIDFMSVEHGFKKSYLVDIFSKAEKQQNIIDSMNRPAEKVVTWDEYKSCLLYTSPSPRDLSTSRMPSSA